MGVSVVPAMTLPWKGSMKITRPSLVCGGMGGFEERREARQNQFLC